jgi:hypothetical protein
VMKIIGPSSDGGDGRGRSRGTMLLTGVGDACLPRQAPMKGALGLRRPLPGTPVARNPAPDRAEVLAAQVRRELVPVLRRVLADLVGRLHPADATLLALGVRVRPVRERVLQPDGGGAGGRVRRPLLRHGVCRDGSYVHLIALQKDAARGRPWNPEWGPGVLAGC